MTRVIRVATIPMLLRVHVLGNLQILRLLFRLRLLLHLLLLLLLLLLLVEDEGLLLVLVHLVDLELLLLIEGLLVVRLILLWNGRSILERGCLGGEPTLLLLLLYMLEVLHLIAREGGGRLLLQVRCRVVGG